MSPLRCCSVCLEVLCSSNVPSFSCRRLGRAEIHGRSGKTRGIRLWQAIAFGTSGSFIGLGIVHSRVVQSSLLAAHPRK
jgi:hypothetical protein